MSHIYTKFGAMPLDSLDKIQLQKWLNEMAEKYSKGLVLHWKFYLKSILSEAREQDYILKSPANKLKSPTTKQVANDTLTPDQFRAVSAELKSPYDLMVIVCRGLGISAK